MADNIQIDVKPHLSIEEAVLFTKEEEHGAQASFVGYVRNHNEGKDVKGLTYDIHVPLAKKIMKEMAEKAQQKWGYDLKIYMGHAIGYLDIGAIAVIVMVSSAHRAESIKACQWIIEEIKYKAPVWKKEAYTDGDSQWVEGHSLRKSL